MRMNTNIPMMGQGVNALGAIDAGNQARFRVNQEQHANALRPLEVQSAQLGIKQQGLNLDLTQQRITDIRRQAAEAARATENKAALAQEYQQAQNGMKMALTAFTTGDERAWQRVTQEFGMPGLPMDERGAAALDAVLSGIGEGLGMPIPQQPAGGDRYKTVGGQLVDLYAEGGPVPVPGIDGRSAGMSFSVGPDGTIQFSEGGPSQVLDRANLKSGSGQARIADPNSPTGTAIVAEPGSDAAREAEGRERAAAAAAETAATRASVVKKATDGIRSLLKDKNFWERLVTADLPEAGVFGQRVRSISQERADLEGRIGTLKGMVAFDRLEKMKQASATGASGLGQVTVIEIELLASQLGALDANLSAPVIMETLETIDNVFGKLSPEAQAYLTGTSNSEPWNGQAPPAQQGAMDFSSMALPDLLSIDVTTIPDDMLDDYSRRLDEVQQ